MIKSNYFNMNMIRSATGLALCAAALTGCGDDGQKVSSSHDPRQNVLVMDDGFDTKAEAFKGRLAGLYTVVCRDEMPSTQPPPASFAEAKARALASLQNRDDRCHLEAGVVDKPDPLARIARYRDRWNDIIRNNQYADLAFAPFEIKEIADALDNDLEKARFHGTATAGVIAHANPSVRLVLVEEQLGNSSSAMDTFTCIKQSDVDQSVALLSDPDVRQASINRPLSTLDEAIQQVEQQHHVGVVNESFGVFSRAALEALQEAKGCPAVDLRRYFALSADLDRARAAAHPDSELLLVKSAGNDHSQIDAAEDDVLCAGAATPRLLVGAYDRQGQLAKFTNFGQCVDAYAPGDDVIAPIPAGWLMPLSGTSFSAPLVVRLVSLAEGARFTAAGAHDAVIGALDGRGRVPLPRFPHDIIYDPGNEARQYALRTEAAAPRYTPSHSELSHISVRRLHQLLAPLSLGR
jgi:subtilisin family serine protease